MNNLIDKARLKFLCRRGMKELDYILQPFFDLHYDQLTSTLQSQFAALLDLEEPQLWDWLVLKQTTLVPLQFKNIVENILTADCSVAV